jgi:hypothetical protein
MLEKPGILETREKKRAACCDELSRQGWMARIPFIPSMRTPLDFEHFENFPSIISAHLVVGLPA